MAFSEKRIEFQFSLANGQFEGGGNSAKVSGLKAECQIVATGGADQSTAEVAIYGMSPSLMNQLSTVGSQYNQRAQNDIDIFAGDDDGLSLVFTGTIFNAYVDGQSMPELCLRIVASPGAYQAVVPSSPLTFKGSADVANLMQNLASQMGLGFENNGVSGKLSNPYYAGTAWGRALEISNDANFEIVIERGTLVITPRGSARQGDALAISSGIGNLVGYPAFVENGVIVKALFDPAAKVFGSIDLQSSLKPACGTWMVRRIDYDLAALAPGGPWFMTLEANPLGTQ